MANDSAEAQQQAVRRDRARRVLVVFVDTQPPSLNRRLIAAAPN
jgi:hypothetical protein